MLLTGFYEKGVIIIIFLGLIVVGLATFFFVKVKNALDNVGGRTFTIREDIELDENWKEIDLEEFNFPEKENNVLFVDSSLPMQRNGFIAPNGDIFVPQIMLEDYKGNKCFLEYKVPKRPPQNSLYFKQDKECFSKPTTYKKLWMKSPVIFNAKIMYRGYNMEDLK